MDIRLDPDNVNAGPAVTQLMTVPGLQFLRFERSLTNDEYREFLTASSAQIDESRAISTRRVVMIIDANNAPGSTSVQRKAQSVWQERYADYFRDYVICGVFLADSALVRGTIRAVGWFKPFPYPHEVVSSIDEAITVACDRLRVAEEPVPHDDDLAKFRALY